MLTRKPAGQFCLNAIPDLAPRSRVGLALSNQADPPARRSISSIRRQGTALVSGRSGAAATEPDRPAWHEHQTARRTARAGNRLNKSRVRSKETGICPDRTRPRLVYQAMRREVSGRPGADSETEPGRPAHARRHQDARQDAHARGTPLPQDLTGGGPTKQPRVFGSLIVIGFERCPRWRRHHEATWPRFGGALSHARARTGRASAAHRLAPRGVAATALPTPARFRPLGPPTSDYPRIASLGRDARGKP
jgi:hypothetical protein